jgi:hypothetical protein
VGDVFGLGTIDQAVPSHLSMNVWSTVSLTSDQCPVATQFAGSVHDTPSRTFSSLEGMLGLGTIDHDVPFHISTRDG